MEEVAKQVQKALAWQHYRSLLIANPLTSGLKNYRPEDLFPDGTSPQVPECYGIYSQCKRRNRLWWDGEMADQPHLMMMEWDACDIGESKFRDVDAPYLSSIDSPPPSQ